MENKTAAVVFRPTNIPAVIGTIQSLNVCPVMPNVSQGVSYYGQRVGNKISPKWCTIQGWLTLDLNSEDQDYDRIAVRMILGFPKKPHLYPDAIDKIQSSPADNWSYNILDAATSPTQFNGTLSAWQYPVNRRNFTVKAERKFTMSRPRIFDAITATTDFARNSTGSYKFFKMRVKCPPTLVYDTGASLRPNNFDPVLMVGYTLLNGAVPPAPDAAAPKPVTLSFTSRLSYEDA